MSSPNYIRYARILKMDVIETRLLLEKMVRNAKLAALDEVSIVTMDNEGFLIYGIPFKDYMTLWHADFEETIEDPARRKLVKLMFKELSTYKLKLSNHDSKQLEQLRSAAVQDMHRAAHPVSLGGNTQ